MCKFPDKDDSIHSSDQESIAGDLMDLVPDVEILADVGLPDVERGSKLLIMIPRMFFHSGPGGGCILESKLIARFEAFSCGEWIQLVAATETRDDNAAVARRRQGRRRAARHHRKPLQANKGVGSVW